MYLCTTKIENEISKGSVEIRHKCYGSAELFGIGHCRFGSAESWFGPKYGNKIRPNRIVRPKLYMRFGRIRRFGAPLVPYIPKRKNEQKHFPHEMFVSPNIHIPLETK